MRKCLVAMLGVIIITMSGFVVAAPMTKDQGDAILQELREIKQLLARQQQQQAQPAPQGPQTPQNLTVKGDAIYVLGKSDAPLTMVEFTDYQCPFCGRFETTTFPDIKKNYIDTGKMRLIVRDLPLEGLHPFAVKAAQAVHCAGDQGKFWEMKDLLFKNQNKLDADSLTGYATKDLALNADTFKSCMANGKHLKEIGDEAKYAQSLGITGTPTFIIGKSAGDSVQGKVIVGALPLEAFQAAIDEVLEKH
ncbi:MAG: DsbA family protein [Gallionella sp.]